MKSIRKIILISIVSFSLTNCSDIQNIQNESKPSFEIWFESIPDSKNDTINYNLKRAYELASYQDLKEFANNPDKHLNSVYLNSDGIYEFMKSKDHPTLHMELEWFYSDDAIQFRNDYYLDDSSDYYRYVPIQK